MASVVISMCDSRLWKKCTTVWHNAQRSETPTRDSTRSSVTCTTRCTSMGLKRGQFPPLSPSPGHNPNGPVAETSTLA